jgi:hypothetical protein
MPSCALFNEFMSGSAAFIAVHAQSTTFTLIMRSASKKLVFLEIFAPSIGQGGPRGYVGSGESRDHGTEPKGANGGEQRR